jgi:hypothetical protein
MDGSSEEVSGLVALAGDVYVLIKCIGIYEGGSSLLSGEHDASRRVFLRLRLNTITTLTCNFHIMKSRFNHCNPQDCFFGCGRPLGEITLGPNLLLISIAIPTN